jgi:hypothetical protein
MNKKDNTAKYVGRTVEVTYFEVGYLLTLSVSRTVVFNLGYTETSNRACETEKKKKILLHDKN